MLTDTLKAAAAVLVPAAIPGQRRPSTPQADHDTHADTAQADREAAVRRDEAARIYTEIERERGYLIHVGDRRADDEITGLYRASQVALDHVRGNTEDVTPSLGLAANLDAAAASIDAEWRLDPEDTTGRL